MSAVRPLPAARRVGRFELRHELGRGAQASVWLGFDSRLEREVAVKLLIPGADSVAVSQWLHEARAVSRLNHPHIVPVFEADEDQGQPYLVFEYVQGPTLSQRLRERGALPGHEAATLMLGVLDALRVAHEAGVIHRDLKPSNILVDISGRARVMDFGIAARLGDGHDSSIVGTPGYMSPEAARGEAPSPGMDVFAAGALLGEMLAGQPLLRESNPYRAIRRIQREDLVLPGEGVRIDDGLRAIVMRAVARDKDRRYASAAQMHEALARWLQPNAASAPALPGSGKPSGTLDFLLRRMRHKSDFPALSQSVARIQRVANSDKESLASLTGEILKDVALTNKLLRMVNSAHFSHAGGGSISTVSRAVALVGFAGIRNMALSLVLLDHMQDKSHAAQLKEEFLRGMMAGQVASGLAHRARDVEEAFLGALFGKLGRLLTEFYFPEEAAQIRQLSRPSAPLRPGALALGEDVAARQVLGLSLEELGLGVAKSWGIPEALQRCMLPAEGEVPARPVDAAQRLPWLARVANEVADAMLRYEPDEAARRVHEIADRYARALELSVRDIERAIGEARERLGQMVQAVGIDLAPGSPARRLVATPTAAQGPAPDSLAGHELRATVVTQVATQVQPRAAAEDKTVVLAAPATPEIPREQAVEMLAAGIQDVTTTLVSDGFRLNEVLRMILETMFRALGFRRVVFCLRDPKTDTLTGRFGLGEGAREAAAAFKVPLKASTPDLFTAVCIKGVDTQIADVASANLAGRMPPWYPQTVNAPSFLLLPLVMKNATFALIYADYAQARSLNLGEQELSLLRTLRSQAVMAFKQVGGA
ncbi:MAG TPA: HDOD domain-containing protein [Burkholderiaceae bacterium]|nr:HDOD domain-containing protein [Burkholderiaceae bacterium]